MRAVSRILVGAVGTGTLLLGLMALAHTPLGRPLLSWLADTAGCPIAPGHADADKVEAFRREHLAQRDGAAAAGEPIAWHFTLGTSRRAVVAEELRRRGYDCRESRRASVLTCDAANTSAYLQFDGSERLVAVDWMREQLSAARAVQGVVELQGELRTRVGPETKSFGAPSADYLTQASLRRVAFEYRYAGYVAKLSATNLGRERGYLLRQQYQWLPPDA